MYLFAANLFPHMHPIKYPIIAAAIGTIVVLILITALCSHKNKKK